MEYVCSAPVQSPFRNVQKEGGLLIWNEDIQPSDSSLFALRKSGKCNALWFGNRTGFSLRRQG